MYNLLIVDDEKIIADGLQMAVRASHLPLKNVDVVYQASAALKRMQTVPYDMILTDIRMPGVDGFALIREAQKIWPRIKAIILTGNRNFDYVRNAMHLQCVDFLIKPARDEELKEALSNVIARLDAEWMDIFQGSYAGNAGEPEKGELLGGRDFMPFQTGREEEVFHILSQTEIALNPNLETDLFLLCFRKSRMGREVILEGIQKIMKTMYGGTVLAYACPCGSRMVFFLMQYLEMKEGIRESLYKTMEEVQSILYEKQDVRMSVTIRRGAKPQRWEEDALELYRRKENGFVCGELVVLEGKEEPEGTGGMEGIMEKIDYYIRKNPEKDLSLGRLAELFCFNSSYLSRAFHQYKGEALSSYIIRIRIERAKKLLLDTDEKIYEIAARCGFETPAYFSRMFNRYEQMSPKEYRMKKRGGTMR